MAAAKKTISLPSEMYDQALARCMRMGYANFSDYIQQLVERDLDERPKHTIVREEPDTKQPPKKGG